MPRVAADRVGRHGGVTGWLLILVLPALVITVPDRAYAQSGLITGDPPLAFWTVPTTSDERLVVAVHGGPGLEHSYLRPEMDALSVVGEVVYYDQRGCGGSGAGQSYGWRDHVEDLRRVIDFHQRGREVVLVGSSFGSVLIALYLGQYPESARAAVVSGLEQAPIPAELEERLGTFCEEANRLSIEGIQEALWVGDELERVPTLVFDDSGPGGGWDAEPYQSGRQWRVSFPSHDPWFTHSDQYLTTVIAFLEDVFMREGGS